MGILYFWAEEPVQNSQGQDCCLIVKVDAPNGIDDQLVQLGAQETIEGEFGKRLTLWAADEDEAVQYLETDPSPPRDALRLAAGVALFYQIAREFAVPDRFSSFTRKIRFGQVEPRDREESGESSLPGSLFVVTARSAGPWGS
jgi:hypothetical protein